MSQTQALKRLRRAHWIGLEKLLKEAYREGVEAGLARAHGQSRRARPIRDDATANGLIRDRDALRPRAVRFRGPRGAPEFGAPRSGRRSTPSVPDGRLRARPDGGRLPWRFGFFIRTAS